MNEFENRKILIVVPCYNEQDTILNVCEELEALAPFCDVLAVNDCSRDNSLRILKENHE
jgi:glycosyltransferase involved in cell wall biosynthesis